MYIQSKPTELRFLYHTVPKNTRGDTLETRKSLFTEMEIFKKTIFRNKIYFQKPHTAENLKRDPLGLQRLFTNQKLGGSGLGGCPLIKFKKFRKQSGTVPKKT